MVRGTLYAPVSECVHSGRSSSQPHAHTWLQGIIPFPFARAMRSLGTAQFAQLLAKRAMAQFGLRQMRLRTQKTIAQFFFFLSTATWNAFQPCSTASARSLSQGAGAFRREGAARRRPAALRLDRRARRRRHVEARKSGVRLRDTFGLRSAACGSSPIWSLRSAPRCGSCAWRAKSTSATPELPAKPPASTCVNARRWRRAAEDRSSGPGSVRARLFSDHHGRE